MSFKDLPFRHRFKAMGDEAEAIFEKTYDEGFARFGLNRPPINLAYVPPNIRYAPDYITSKGFVEVQGFGRDQTLKLKLDKLAALKWWHRAFRADLFVWDSHKRRFGWLRIVDLVKAQDSADLRSFPEGKEYLAWAASHLPIVDDWQEFEECPE